jgi:hypothetical protein
MEKGITQKEFDRVWMLGNFVYNNQFTQIREIIDIKFDEFYKKLCLNSSNQKVLNDNTKNFREIFYNIVFNRISHDSFLMEAVVILYDTNEKIKVQKSLNHEPNLYDKLLLKVSLNTFKPIIDELFEIPNVILAALEPKIKNLSKKVEETKANLKRNVLQPEDKTFIQCLKIFKLILEGITRYKAIQITANQFCEDENNLKSKFNNFCKTRSINYKDKSSINQWIKKYK